MAGNVLISEVSLLYLWLRCLTTAATRPLGHRLAIFFSLQVKHLFEQTFTRTAAADIDSFPTRATRGCDCIR